MGKKLVFYSVVFALAFIVLFASIFRSASVNYAFGESETSLSDKDIPQIDYQLPGTGAVGPDDPVWFLEVLRDKVQLTFTQNNLEKAKLLLLTADKRIAYAEQLKHRKQIGEAISVAEKAEIYLNASYEQIKLDRSDTNWFMKELSLASLKHREILEKMYLQFPDEARPRITTILNTTKNVFEKSTHRLNELQSSVVITPFSD